ncbi:hypothetical protein HGRIS_006108 [Hohenbuehelia grisea]|uniref:Nucleoside diphosphate kinase n=1 Tax=Hohenbuehelia grisea TaxID=104357 RepID=A0ABR3K1J3_9AGAR
MTSSAKTQIVSQSTHLRKVLRLFTPHSDRVFHLNHIRGPVWVYVLERRRAVEVWQTLMGPADVAVARQEAPTSLRALYGRLPEQLNAVMGSPDAETAEAQIQAIFASSPPFPTSDLPPGDDRFDSMRSVASSLLEALRSPDSESGAPPSSIGDRSTSTHSGRTANASSAKSGSGFRARALPATHLEPDIKPRMSKAAALRAGIPYEATARGPRAPPTKEQLAKTFANVPGHKRSETIQVASTAAPTIAPRMTRAAALRLGLPVPAAPRRQSTAPASLGSNGDAKPLLQRKDTFEGVPGHKRRESIAVASSKPPTVAPRLNKSAALRAQKDSAPPSSFMFRAPSARKVPGLSRSNSVSSLNGSSRPASQSSMHAPASRPSLSRPASAILTRPPSSTPKPSAPKINGRTSSVNGVKTNGGVNGTTEAAAKNNAEQPKAKPKPRPSSLSAPTIAPRPNRSAMLRAAKMEAQNAAKVVKPPKGKPAAPRAIAA